MAFFFGYTGVKTDAQNLGFACAISVTINIYYVTLYAYTVEVLPSAHRGTGNGIAVALNRLMGTCSALIVRSPRQQARFPYMYVLFCWALLVSFQHSFLLNHAEGRASNWDMTVRCMSLCHNRSADAEACIRKNKPERRLRTLQCLSDWPNLLLV